MRAADARTLAPFVSLVHALHDATRKNYERCRCTLDDQAGRRTYRMSASCKTVERGGRMPWPCHTAAEAAIRTTLGRVRLPVDHLDSLELLIAVDELHTLTLKLPTLSPAAFQIGVNVALRAHRLARPRKLAGGEPIVWHDAREPLPGHVQAAADEDDREADYVEAPR